MGLIEGVKVIKVLSLPPIWASVGLALSIILLLLSLFVLAITNSTFQPLIITILGICLMCPSLYGVLNLVDVSNDEYIVIVEDTVKFNDFMEHYEILKQIGDGVYQIRERVDT